MANKNSRKKQRQLARTDQSKANSGAVVFQSESWNGPLPPPGILNAYSKNIQDSIVRGADEYRNHAINDESKITDAQVFIAKNASITHSVSVIALFVIGSYSVAIGNNAVFGYVLTSIATAIEMIPRLVKVSKKDK